MIKTDFLIVGGGIVGIATALKLQNQYPDQTVTVLEKETRLAAHQTGHNSGVLHAGVYYEPNSLKARFCGLGVDRSIAFCKEHAVAYNQCGKMIVATNEDEVTRLERLNERCLLNGLNPIQLDEKALFEGEPHIKGLSALFIDKTAIVDYVGMTEKMAEIFQNKGGKIQLSHEVLQIDEKHTHVDVRTDRGRFQAGQIIVCGGLQADRLALMAGLETNIQIIPFRGEYYQLAPRHNQIVNHLIYPVPNPAMPFLGVHLTRMIDGSVTVGPNAVLGLARENYDKFSFNGKDFFDMLKFKGFWKLGLMNWRFGLSEFHNSLNKRQYLKRCQTYCPSLRLDDLKPYRSGIRAMAVLKDGTMVHDFMIKKTERMLHVLNAPSPAATSALPIGEYLVSLL